MDPNEKPGFLFSAAPGQRRAMIALAQELDRRDFSFLYCPHGAGGAIEPGQQHVARPYRIPAPYDSLGQALVLISGQPIPAHSFGGVLRDAAASVVHVPELVLRLGVPLLGVDTEIG